MIKATINGDFSTKNVVDEYSRLIDNYSGRFVDEYSGSNLQMGKNSVSNGRVCTTFSSM